MIHILQKCTKVSTIGKNAKDILRYVSKAHKRHVNGVRRFSGCSSSSSSGVSTSDLTKSGQSKPMGAVAKIAAMTGQPFLKRDGSILGGNTNTSAGAEVVAPAPAPAPVPRESVDVLKEDCTGYTAVLQRMASMCCSLVERTVSTNILHVGMHIRSDVPSASASPLNDALRHSADNQQHVQKATNGGDSANASLSSATETSQKGFLYFLGESRIFDIIGVSDEPLRVQEVLKYNSKIGLGASNVDLDVPSSVPTDAAGKTTVTAYGQVSQALNASAVKPPLGRQEQRAKDMADFLRGDSLYDVDDKGRIFKKPLDPVPPTGGAVDAGSTGASAAPAPEINANQQTAKTTSVKKAAAGKGSKAVRLGFYRDALQVTPEAYSEGVFPFAKYKFQLLVYADAEDTAMLRTPIPVDKLLASVCSGGYAIVAVSSELWEEYNLFAQMEDLHPVFGEKASLLSIQEMQGFYIALIRRAL